MVDLEIQIIRNQIFMGHDARSGFPPTNFNPLAALFGRRDLACLMVLFLSTMMRKTC